MTLIIPSAAEIADSLNVWKMGGDLRVLAHACRSKAPEYCQLNPDGATRLLRAAAAMELAADLVDAMGKEGGKMTSRSPWNGKMFPPNQTPSDANLSLPHGLLMHGVAHPLMDIPSPVSACASDVSGRTKS